MSSLSSDGVSEILKIILAIVIGICFIGIIFWIISDKFPMYAAKKEVSITLLEISNSYRKWSQSADEPVTIDYIFKNGWVVLSKEVKSHWVFELHGDPANRVVAQSLQGMPGGRDRFVYMDIETGLQWGWGIPATDDSIREGLLKHDAYRRVEIQEPKEPVTK